MPVQSVDTMVRERIRDFLEERVGEDMVATYGVHVVNVDQPCDHGHYVEVPCWLVSIHLRRAEDAEAAKHSEPPEDAEAPAGGYSLAEASRRHRLNLMLPYELLLGGDMEPLETVLGELWSDHSFMRLMAQDGLDAELERLAAEGEGG